MKHLAPGISESLIDEFLRDAIAQRPVLRTVFGKIDPEEQPGIYTSFVAKMRKTIRDGGRVVVK